MAAGVTGKASIGINIWQYLLGDIFHLKFSQFNEIQVKNLTGFTWAFLFSYRSYPRAELTLPEYLDMNNFLPGCLLQSKYFPKYLTRMKK